MNVNDIVYKVAESARVLADEKINYLRRSAASQEAHTEHAVWMETRHKTRGEMIEEILTDEFIEEFPKDIEEDEVKICLSCGRPQGECDAEQAAIAEHNDQG